MILTVQMVPEYRPEQGYAMAQRFVQNKPF